MKWQLLWIGVFVLGLPAESTAAETGWIKSGQESGITIFTRDRAGSDIREVKAVGIIDAAPHACMNVVEDLANFKHFMPHTKESSIVGREPDGAILAYQFLTLPLVSDRDYVLRVTDETPTTAPGQAPKYFKSAWTVSRKGPPPRDGVVRVVVNDGYWMFESADGGKRTRATYYLYTNPGGMLPSFIINKANTTTLPDLFAAVRTQAQIKRYQAPRMTTAADSAAPSPASAPKTGG